VGVSNFAFLTPVYITCFTDIMILGPVLTFVGFQRGWCANEATRELEDPFGGDGNDFFIIDFNCPPINGLMEIGAALVVTRECEEQLARPNEPSRAALEIKRRENQIRPHSTFKARGGA